MGGNSFVLQANVSQIKLRLRRGTQKSARTEAWTVLARIKGLVAAAS
jgi:hypothetical protein